MLDRHVLPALGHHELAQIRPSTIRQWYMALRKDYVTTADDAYRMVRAVLMTAVADEMIPRNPCQVRGAGQARSAERPTASVGEVNAAVAGTPRAAPTDRSASRLVSTATG